MTQTLESPDILFFTFTFDWLHNNENNDDNDGDDVDENKQV